MAAWFARWPRRTRAGAGGLLLLVAFLFLTASRPASAESFDSWLRAFWTEARGAGISEGTLSAAFDGLQLDPEVLERAQNQAEFVKPLWEYLDGAVSSRRLATGREMLARYERELAGIESRYGVSRYVVTAIWGMESSYGAVLANSSIVRPTIRCLATLAYADPERGGFARKQLLAALHIVDEGHVEPSRMVGSWAGAMGHTQFIPTTFRDYAVDHDGDGRRDIWSSVPDALASTANYLARNGWADGETWGYEVNLPRGFDYALADEVTERSVTEWEKVHGVRRTYGRSFPRPDDQAVLILPAGASGPAFLMLRNFSVIKRYNNATSYALGVGHLADRLAGGGPFEADWPTNDRPLTRSQKEEMQRLLLMRGFDPGGVDGRVGPMTRSAIRSFQGRAGLPADGYASYDLLQMLRGG